MKQALRSALDALSKSRKFRKANLAASITFSTLIGQALVAGTLTGGLALAALGAALLAGVAVYRVPNSES